MPDIKERVFDILLDIDSPYSAEYNSFKQQNPKYCENHKMRLYLYLAKLKLAQLKKLDPKSIGKPNASGNVPIIESQASRRPGEKRLLETLSSYDVVSFDIFDTAVFRNVEEPRDIFRILSCETGFENFKHMRMEAEKEAKLRSYARCGSDEATLDEIYDVLKEKNNIDKKCMQKEIDLEIYLCVPNLYIKRIYDKLILNGKKVIFSTDMYLPRAVIETILEKNGYGAHDRLYISSELKISKKDGTMQKRIREQYGNECKIIHVGDNHTADIKNSKIWGFDTFFYRSVRDVSKPFLEPRYGDISESFSRGIINNSLHNGVWRKSIHYEHGYKVGGILLAGYCEHINNVVTERDIDLILFCARDCDVIYKAYNKIYPSVESKYISVSRYALMNIAPERYMIDLIDRTFANVHGKNMSINNFMISIGLDYFDDILEGVSISGHDQINDKNIYRIKETIIKNISIILDHNKNQILSAKRYFGKILKGHKNILIVDIGWSGSSITILKYFIEENISSEYNVQGSLLFGNGSDSVSSSVSSGLIEVYVSSSVKNRDIFSIQFPKDKDIIQKNNQMLEYLFSSTASSLVRYDFDLDGGMAFIRSLRKCNNPTEILDMQRGMIDFIEKYEKYTKAFRHIFSIPAYVAYAPFSKILKSEEYTNMVYQNFTYDAAIFQGKESDNTTFGKKYPSKLKKNKILLISHSFSHTGAPHSLLRIGKALLELGYYCEVWAPHSGSM